LILVVYRDDGRVLGALRNAEVREREVWSGGHRVLAGGSWRWKYVPDQEIPRDKLGNPSCYVPDLRRFTPEEEAALIDQETGRAINVAVHPFAGIEEQVGILRDQLVHVLNALGIEPTEEFARLNEIAIKEIEAAREKKEEISAQDNSS